MMRVKFEFSDVQGKVHKYIIWRLRSVGENVVSYVTSSKQVTELNAWVKYDTKGALQWTSLAWFYSSSPTWNTSGLITDGASYSGITCGFSQPFHTNLQLFLCYTKYMVNFSCFNYHWNILSFDFLTMCNGLTTHHPLSLLINLVIVNHITETKPDHGYMRTAATWSVWWVGFPIIQ